MMQDDQLVRVEHLWKKFSRSNAGRQRAIRSSMRNAVRNRPSKDELQDGEFWAIQDLSFSLSAGDSIAVLGLNGSGKSTLLRLMGGFAYPDRGQITTIGTTSAFINLSTGLNPELSGRDNIFLKGSLNGKSKSYIDALLDEIIAFSELEHCIDAPVSTYSSGMKLRLAFSVGIHDSPDILLVDEVLAVGDFLFKQKCLAAIQAMQSRCAIVLVSHSMNDVRRFCDSAIVLDAGQIGHQGDVDKGIDYYLSKQQEERTPGSGQPFEKAATIERSYHSNELISDIQASFNGSAWTTETQPVKADRGAPLKLGIRFQLPKPVQNLVVGIPIHTATGEVVTAFSTECGLERFPSGTKGHIELQLDVPQLPLNPGSYNVMLSIVDGPKFLHRSVVAQLVVKPNRDPYWGTFSADASWTKAT